MRTAMLLGMTAIMVAGCAPLPPGWPRAVEGEEISYQTAPCFGTCPVYTVSIRPDGSGTFEGTRFTQVTGTREFQADAGVYRRFSEHLLPYRPDAERIVQPGSKDCTNAPTDMPGVDVRWSEQTGASRHLSYYYGCGQGNEAMAAALRSAPDMLPIADLVGKR